MALNTFPTPLSRCELEGQGCLNLANSHTFRIMLSGFRPSESRCVVAASNSSELRRVLQQGQGPARRMPQEEGECSGVGILFERTSPWKKTSIMLTYVHIW